MCICAYYFHRGEFQLSFVNSHEDEDLGRYNEIHEILQKTPPGPATQSSFPDASGGDHESTTSPTSVPVTDKGQSSVPFVQIVYDNPEAEETQTHM